MLKNGQKCLVELTYVLSYELYQIVRLCGLESSELVVGNRHLTFLLPHKYSFPSS